MNANMYEVFRRCKFFYEIFRNSRYKVYQAVKMSEKECGRSGRKGAPNLQFHFVFW